MGFISVIVVICAVIIATATCASIPSYIHICKRSDPDVSKCIRESIEFLRPKLRDGIAKLDVPKLEPFHIPDIVISRPENTGYRALLKNIDIYGASDFQLTKLKLNVPNLVFRIGVVIPLLRFVGNYDVDASILQVPIKGEGQFTANATNCIANAVLRAEVQNVKGVNIFHFTSLEVKLQIGDYNLQLENLFNGDKILSQAVNDVLNQNKQEFIPAATPFIEKKISEIILEIANKIVKKFNYDEVFPEK